MTSDLERFMVSPFQSRAKASGNSSSSPGIEKSKKRPVDYHPMDRFFASWLRLSGISLVLLLLSIAIFLTSASWPTIKMFGVRFIWSTDWDPVRSVFGALPVIFGTCVSSLLALALAAPLGVGVAVFLSEIAPENWGRTIGFLVEMLAAIPSVVYGLWGIFVLAPWLRDTVQPFLTANLGFLPFFQGAPFGLGMMAAGVILAIMVIPTICALSKEVFRAIPLAQREAALALGATRWETIRISVLAAARPGILGAVILGMGRAIGETMAVTMVIGNRAEISWSLLAPGQTMASVVANEYAEALSKIHLSALTEIGLLLFAVSFIMNGTARIFISRWALGRASKGTSR